MSLGILGNKIGMTQIFDKLGVVIPVTLIKVGPCIITGIKSLNIDGYNAIQVGYGDISLKSVNKCDLGHFQKLNLEPLKYLKEYTIDNPQDFSIGQIIDTEVFKNSVKFIDVSGITAGKGFSGLQKRHDFGRGPMTHGSKSHRSPGSIGMGTTPGRVFPGKKMSGQLGNKKTTVKQLKIISIDSNDHILIVQGSVPGKPGNLLNIRISNK